MRSVRRIRTRTWALVLALTVTAALSAAGTRAAQAPLTEASHAGFHYLYDHDGAQYLGSAETWEAGMTWSNDGQARIVTDPEGAFGQVAQVYVRGYGHGRETSWVKGTFTVPAGADVVSIPLTATYNDNPDADVGVEFAVHHAASGQTVMTYASHIVPTQLGVSYVVGFADVSQFAGQSVELTIRLRQPDVCGGASCTANVDLYIGDLSFESLPDICTTEADGSHTLYHYYDDPTPLPGAICANPQSYYFVDVEDGPYNHYGAGNNTYRVTADLPAGAQPLQFNVYYGYKSRGFTINDHALDPAQTYAAFPTHQGHYINIAEPSRWMPLNDNPSAVAGHLVAGLNTFSFNVYTEKSWEERHFDLWARFRVAIGDATPPAITNIRESHDPINARDCPDPAHFVIRADVTDTDSGIEWVRVHYRIWRRSHYHSMRHETGNTYRSPYMGATGPATYEYSIVARDKAGNEARSVTNTLTV